MSSHNKICCVFQPVNRRISCSLLVKIIFVVINVIPENICQNNVPVVNISESFAEFFDKKVSNIVNQMVISDNVYSGRRKIHAEVEMFMTEFNINDCIKSLKIKNTEGYDSKYFRAVLCTYPFIPTAYWGDKYVHVLSLS